MHDSADALVGLPMTPKDLGKPKMEKGKADIFGFPKSLGLFHAGVSSQSLSQAARERLLMRRGEPLFFADWDRVLMIHYEVDAATLQGHVPFSLDLLDGKAFVSLVAFTLRGMRPRLPYASRRS